MEIVLIASVILLIAAGCITGGMEKDKWYRQQNQK